MEHLSRSSIHPSLGCRLRPVDVEFMKALHEKVNIVPLIAKADCLIPSEIKKLKERVSKSETSGPRAVELQGVPSPSVELGNPEVLW